jgi:hypothetical protein
MNGSIRLGPLMSGNWKPSSWSLNGSAFHPVLTPLVMMMIPRAEFSLPLSRQGSTVVPRHWEGGVLQASKCRPGSPALVFSTQLRFDGVSGDSDDPISLFPASPLRICRVLLIVLQRHRSL